MAEPGAREPEIVVQGEPRRMRARIEGFTVARSDRALALAEGDRPVVHYFPRNHVAMNALRLSDRQTYCPYKGTTEYFHIDGPGGRAENAAWSYPAPYPAVAAIAGHIAFEPGSVVVESIAEG